jgi:hypothetical protein
MFTPASARRLVALATVPGVSSSSMVRSGTSLKVIPSAFSAL